MSVTPRKNPYPGCLRLGFVAITLTALATHLLARTRNPTTGQPQ